MIAESQALTELQIPFRKDTAQGGQHATCAWTLLRHLMHITTSAKVRGGGKSELMLQNLKPIDKGGCSWDGTQVMQTLTANNAGGNQRMPDKMNFTCVLCRVPYAIEGGQRDRDEKR